MKYVVATVAGIAILLLFAIVGAGLGWRNAGGAIAQVLLWSAIVSTWIAIVKNWPAGPGEGGSRSGPRSPRSQGVTGGQGAAESRRSGPPPVPGGHTQESWVATVTEDMVQAAYAEAWSECEEGRQDKGLWAKAFAEANGDENKTRAAYLRMRVGVTSLGADGNASFAAHLGPVPGGSTTGVRASMGGVQRVSSVRSWKNVAVVAVGISIGVVFLVGGVLYLIVLGFATPKGQGHFKEDKSDHRYATVSEFLSEYRKQNPAIKDIGDETLYSAVSRAYPETSSMIKDAPAPKITDWPSMVAAYKEWNPNEASTPDIDIATRLRDSTPLLKVFDRRSGHWYVGW